MENSYRLKVKVGHHEFDADGPRDAVEAQFQVWKELIASAPPSQYPSPQNEAGDKIPQPPTENPSPTQDDIDSALEKIMKVESRIVSLTVRPESSDEAVLLIMYGQKVQRNNDSVTGSEILSGLVTTGGTPVNRVDRLLEKLAADGDVIVTGQRRSKRYRLTNSGLQKSRSLAGKWLAIVA